MSQEEAIALFRCDDLIELGMRADEMRRRLHPCGVVSYTIGGTCDWHQDSIFDEIRETVDRGGTGILLRGEIGVERPVEWYEALLRDIKRRFAVECEALAGRGLTEHDTLARLRDAGLDSITGGGVEIHRAAHALGMRTTAAVRFGGGESIEDSVDRMEAIRRVQEETGGFAAFVPLVEDATAVEYLKALAISRIYLDQIVNVEVRRDAAGLKTCQVGLRFGGNDMGSAATEEELRRVIRDAGFLPKQRDAIYSTYFLN